MEHCTPLFFEMPESWRAAVDDNLWACKQADACAKVALHVAIITGDRLCIRTHRVSSNAGMRTRWTAFQGLGGMESNMAARRRTQGSGMKSPLDARICALFTYMPDRSSSISYTAAPSASCRTAHLASTSYNTRVELNAVKYPVDFGGQRKQ